MCYNEEVVTKFIFYDGRGSNVYGTDFSGEDFYSNEYGPRGEILYFINYSNISFACSLYDEDLGSYIEEATGAKTPFSNLSYSVSKDLPTFKKISLNFESNAKSTGIGQDWIWI